MLPALAAEPEKKPATEQAATVERAPVLERSQEDAQALERQLPQQEQQTLQAGNDSFLALWKPANSTDPTGAVVIVPGAGESADWPVAVGPVRQKLPDANWQSLSLSLPDLSSDAPVARAVKTPSAPVAADSKATPPVAKTVEQATAAENPDSAAAADSPQAQADADAERIFARIDAGIAFAQQHKARSIVLMGHGTGAYWAARYLKERQQPHVQRLLMVAPVTPTDARQSLEELAPTLKVPTGDLYYVDNRIAREAALQRLQASKRLKGSGYTQVGLKALPGNRMAEQEQLFRRIRGWLSPMQPQKPAF
jgi:pimeloyl-ACP methyl ester carboxylesterase